MTIRVFARIRKDFPLFFILLPFLSGQIAGLFTVGWTALMAVALAAILVCKASFRFLTLTLVYCILGYLSGFISVNSFQNIKFDPDISYIGEVASDPRRTKVGQISFEVELNNALKNRIFCKAIDLPWRNAGKVEKGDKIVFRGTFKNLNKELNPFSYSNYLIRKGLQSECKIEFLSIYEKSTPAFYKQIQNKVNDKVRSVVGDTEEAGVFLSMMIGTRDVLGRETEEAFKRTGLAHLLVVSGYQVTLVYSLCFMIIRRTLLLVPNLYLLIRISLVSNLIAVILAALFVLVCGVEGSSLRAILASVITFIAKTLERGGGFLNSILTSLLVLSIIWPGVILEPGTQLTYAALLGICAATYKSNDSNFAFVKVCNYVTLATSVVVLFWFEGFSLLSFVLNPIFALVFSLICCNFGLFAVLLSHSPFDYGGFALSHLANLNYRLVGLIKYISEFDFAYFEILKPYNYLGAGFFALCCARILNRNFKRYRVENGL